MTKITLTDSQEQALEVLKDSPLTTSRMANKLEMTSRQWWTYDKLHSLMRRLEDRELVRRASEHPIVWELTHTGRAAISS